MFLLHIFAKTVLRVCDQAGFSALHLAAQNGHNESARILLFAGCSPDHRNSVCFAPRLFAFVLLMLLIFGLSLIAVITDYFGGHGRAISCACVCVGVQTITLN